MGMAVLITHGESTEIEGVYWQRMQQPWLWSVCICAVYREHGGIRCRRAIQLPYAQGIVASMPIKRCASAGTSIGE